MHTQIMDNTLWYPENSLADKCEDQEPNYDLEVDTSSRKRKKKKGVKIERRQEATVDVRLATANNELESRSTGSLDSSLPGYNTIEKSSLNGLEKFENWKEADQDGTCVNGWKGDEDIARMVLHRSFHTTVTNDTRNLMQSRGVCSNRLYSSHLNTQMSKKREKYRFTHAKTAKDHMKTYNESCSYSFLILYNKKSSRNVLPKEGIVKKDTQVSSKEKAVNVEKKEEAPPRQMTTLQSLSNGRETRPISRSHQLESSVPMIPLVTSVSSSSGDRVLRTLANRLGVKESIDEPKLLSSPVRPTPPSITKKKNESREDLVLYAEKKKYALSSNS